MYWIFYVLVRIQISDRKAGGTFAVLLELEKRARRIIWILLGQYNPNVFPKIPARYFLREES